MFSCSFPCVSGLWRWTFFLRITSVWFRGTKSWILWEENCIFPENKLHLCIIACLSSVLLQLMNDYWLGTNGIVLTSHRDPKNLSRATLSVLMLKPGCKRNLFGKLLNKTIRRWLAKSLVSCKKRNFFFSFHCSNSWYGGWFWFFKEGLNYMIHSKAEKKIGLDVINLFLWLILFDIFISSTKYD